MQKRFLISNCITLVAATLVTVLAFAEDLYVQVRTTALRTTPEQFSQSVALLSYGDKLAVLSQAQGWFKVISASGAAGFVHGSAVTKKRVVISNRPDLTEARADVSDVVLAGKGLNAIIESEYAKKVGEEHYRLVDKIESLTYTQSEIEDFIREGRLK